MPSQIIKDPQTGQEVEVYVAPKAASSPPKAKAKPAPKKDDGGVLGAVGALLENTPLGAVGAGFSASSAGVGAAVDALQRTGDVGQAFGKGSQAYMKALEGPGIGKGVVRTIANAGRNAAQELSDLVTADIPAAFGDTAIKGTSKDMPDAPFLGFLPALPKAKSSGPAEDLVTGIAQVAIEWLPATKAVGLVGKGLKALPGATQVAKGTKAAGDSYRAAKATQIAKLPAAAQKPAAIAAGAGEAIVSNVVGKGAATGALIDFAGFDQHGGRLYDLVDNLTQQVTGTPLEIPFLDYLKSKPGDVGLSGRLKNAVEGAFVGSSVEFLMRAFRAAKYVDRLRNAAPDDVPVAAQAAKEATEDLEAEMVRQGTQAQQEAVAALPPAAPLRVEPQGTVDINQPIRDPEGMVEPTAAPAPAARVDRGPQPTFEQLVKNAPPGEPDPEAWARRMTAEYWSAPPAGVVVEAPPTVVEATPAAAAEPSVPSAGTPEPAAPRATPAQVAETKALLDRAMANLPPEKRAAVQAELERRAMGDTAPATAPAPASPAIEIPAGASRKITARTDESRIQVAAESLYNWANSGIPGERQLINSVDDALDLVRQKGAILDPDAIPGLDMAKAREIKTRGTMGGSPETEAVARAYQDFYGVNGGRTLASDAPRGWGSVDTSIRMLPDSFVKGLQREITEDIRRIAGDDVAIRFERGVVMLPGKKAWGYKKGQMQNVGGWFDPVEDLIQVNRMAMPTGTADKRQTGFHEAFHRVQHNFLATEELKALNSFWGQLRVFAGAKPKIVRAAKEGRKIALIEQQAIAFEKYAYARSKGIEPIPYILGVDEQELAMGLAATGKDADGFPTLREIKGAEKLSIDVLTKGLNVLDTLLDFVEKSNNYLRGRGWTSTKSIFDQAYSGELAKTRADLGSAYDDYGARAYILDSIRDTDDIPLTDANRGILFSEADEVPVNAPTPDEAWATKFVDQMLANRAQLEAGEVTMEDLLANNVQKLESPSGRKYQPIQPPLMVEAYRAHSDLVSRPDATGIPVMTDERIMVDTAAWLEKANYSSQAVLENLKRLSGPLSAYRENLVALRAAALYVDHTNLQAGTAANRWLNGQMDEAADMGKLTAELVTAAAQQDRANRAFESVTRPLGQLLRSTQIPRPAPGSIPFDDAAAPVGKNIAEEMEQALVKDQDELVADTIGSRISPEAQEAILTGQYDNPKVIEEFNALALNMAQGAVTPGFSQGFWKKFNSSLNLGANGLMMYRSSQLLSSGITFWGNVINSALRTVELPLTQAAGALVTGHPVRASRSLMIYGQYVSNLANAFRMGVESFKVGRGLFDMDRSQVDFLDRLAKQDADGEMLAASPQQGEWDLNTMPWLSVQDKSNWAMAQKRLWQGLNLSTRLQVSADSAFKSMVGQSFEYVRNLQPGLDHAVRMGMDGNSKEAWKFAQDYAQAAVDRNLKDVTIDGRTILDGVMDSPHAQTATRWATFTDDIWASMETRTTTRGMELAEAKGLKGDEAMAFAQQYVEKGQKVMGMGMDDIPFFARTFSLMPQVWQSLLDSPFRPLFALIQPFNRTPGDIVKSVARKTPLAPLVDTWWRDVFSEDAMTRDRAWGDIATGAAAISLASIAMTHGRIEFTGGGPGNPGAKRKWMEQEGKQPYSFRIRTGEDENGNPVFSDWISMRALDPYASLFGGLADYQELANKVTTEARERLGSALVMDLVSAVAAGQLQKSYYQGFTEVYEMAMGLGELDIAPNRRHPVARYVERLVASFVPGSSSLRAGRRLDDPIARDVPASNNPNLAMRLFEETVSEIKNMLPGYSTELPTKRNWITGDPIFLSGVWGDQFLPPESPWLSYALQFSPASPFQKKAEPGEAVLREMGQLTGRGAGFIGPRATDFTDGGKIKENRLSPYEYEQYILAVSQTPDQFGRTLLQALEEEVTSELYQSNPPGQPSEQVVSFRAAALNQVIAQYLKLGRETFLSSPAGKRLAENADWAEGANREVQFRLKYGQEIDPQSFIEGLR